MFIFGRPARFLPLEPRSAVAVLRPPADSDAESGGSKAYGWDLDGSSIASAWDERLAACADAYRQRMYGLLTDNCHAFVVNFLNTICYRGRSSWTMVDLALMVFLGGRYAGWDGALRTWAPFVLTVVLGGYFGRLLFLYVYLAVVGPLLAWFLFYTYVIWKPWCTPLHPQTALSAPVGREPSSSRQALVPGLRDSSGSSSYVPPTAPLQQPAMST